MKIMIDSPAAKGAGVSPGLVALLIIWVSAIFFALYQFGSNRLVNFDPKGLLVTEAADMAFESRIERLANEQLGALTNSVIHFVQSDCACNRIASTHINSVKDLVLSFESKRNIEIDIDETQSWRQFVPSTPAIAVFDATGSLSYFGPYSSGYYCSAGNGLVEPFIDNSNELGATIVSDSKGCYCSTS